MDEQKAKFLLQSGHPRPGDAEDPAFREASELASAQPELGAWVREQQDLADALQRKLAEVPIPADLRARLLAGGAVTRPKRGINRREWLAMAAGFVVLGSAALWKFGSFRFGGGTDLAALRRDMTAFLAGSFSLELQSRQLDRLKTHLAEKHDFSNFEIAPSLADKAGVGCRKIDWHEHQVMLICFSVEGQLVHLLITPKTTLPEVLPDSQLGDAVVEGWATTAWSDDRNVYLVITPGSAEFLKRTLAQNLG